MAPELLRGHRPRQAADVHSLLGESEMLGVYNNSFYIFLNCLIFLDCLIRLEAIASRLEAIVLNRETPWPWLGRLVMTDLFSLLPGGCPYYNTHTHIGIIIEDGPPFVYAR